MLDLDHFHHTGHREKLRVILTTLMFISKVVTLYQAPPRQIKLGWNATRTLPCMPRHARQIHSAVAP